MVQRFEICDSEGKNIEFIENDVHVMIKQKIKEEVSSEERLDRSLEAKQKLLAVPKIQVKTSEKRRQIHDVPQATAQPIIAQTKVE